MEQLLSKTPHTWKAPKFRRWDSWRAPNPKGEILENPKTPKRRLLDSAKTQKETLLVPGMENPKENTPGKPQGGHSQKAPVTLPREDHKSTLQEFLEKPWSDIANHHHTPNKQKVLEGQQELSCPC